MHVGTNQCGKRYKDNVQLQFTLLYVPVGQYEANSYGRLPPVTKVVS
jgi:hypothetical protein